MPKFKPVDPQPNFPEAEKQLLTDWYESGLVEEYLHRNDKSDKKFKFIDGPITANNPMGIHHAWGRTYKDLWQRWHNMLGYKQRFQNGFDSQGLWVEVEVERELGLKNKKEIEKLGIDKFVELCKERVLKFSGIQTEQSKRLGMFMDWPNSYYTMSDENNYMIWAFLKKVHEKGWLYKGHDSVPWCPRCGTAISQHEILTEEYQEITHKAVFVKYRLKGKKEEFLLVWTTTPWTLPANVAVAVNPDLTYVKVEQAGEVLYLAEDLLKVLEPGYKIVEKIPGKKLVGWEYEGAYDSLPAVKKQLGKYIHRVVSSSELVNSEEGTGLVHIAPGAGEEDFKLGKEEKLPVVEAIDEAANYLEGFGGFTGKSAKDNPDLIVDEMARRDLIYKVENYTHRYPVCWRCKTELVWRVVDEWYISMDELRPKIASVAKRVKWIPGFGLERELDWLKNMHDWLISKKRYWGLALPIWECVKCGNFEVIGSETELKERAVKGWERFEGHTPHRPWVDEIVIICSKCGAEANRIKDVGNPWLDAGIVPFSTLNYRTDKGYWKEWFPANFITESFPGQFKNWFYSLLVMSTVLENTNPFETVLGFATLMGEDGSEMHKSKGNLIVFDEGAEKIGVDVMRWMFLRHNPENNLNFGYHMADDVRRNFYLILYNVYRFFVDYVLLDGYQPGKVAASKNVLDRWLTSRINETLAAVNKSLGRYDGMTASLALEELTLDFSTWWLRRSRERMGPWTKDNADKKQAYDTFYQSLVALSKILAPFIPYLSDEMYRNLTGEKSVHLADWPESGESDAKLISEMAAARQVVELGHRLRKERQVKLRQPLATLTYSLPAKLSTEVEKVLSDELNVKAVRFHKTTKKEPLVDLDFELTDELKAEGEARDIIRQTQDERKRLNLDRTTRVRVTLPSVPKGWGEEIARATVAELKEGKEFAVEVSSEKSGELQSKKTD